MEGRLDRGMSVAILRAHDPNRRHRLVWIADHDGLGEGLAQCDRARIGADYRPRAAGALDPSSAFEILSNSTSIASSVVWFSSCAAEWQPPSRAGWGCRLRARPVWSCRQMDVGGVSPAYP